MAATACDAGWNLLWDLEAHHGRLALHRGNFPSDHGDREWTRAAYGSWLEEWLDKRTTPSVSMDDGLLSILRTAAILLRPDLNETIANLAIGWTSIPILNACAVRRIEALAIALNHRLYSVFGAANAITWDIELANLKNKTALRERAEQRLIHILQASSKERFDLALSTANPWPSKFHFQIGYAFSHVQMLFVLLHELGHVILGHLEREELWAGHPLTDTEFVFFNSSHEAEYSADRFAVDSIMQADATVWAEVVSKFELPDPQNIFPSRMILKLIGRIFLWFHAIAPKARDSSEARPTSHPHPLDRLDAIFIRYPIPPRVEPANRAGD